MAVEMHKSATGVTAEAVISAAEKFHKFVTADSVPQVAIVKPAVHSAPQAAPKQTEIIGKPATAPKPAAAAKPAKPAAPAKTEEQLVAEFAAEEAAKQAAADAAEATTAAVTVEVVGDAIQAMLSANKRKEAINLLAKFGAKSASSVAEEDRAAFVTEAEAILLAA